MDRELKCPAAWRFRSPLTVAGELQAARRVQRGKSAARGLLYAFLDSFRFADKPDVDAEM
jgi:hypothetical protein